MINKLYEYIVLNMFIVLFRYCIILDKFFVQLKIQYYKLFRIKYIVYNDKFGIVVRRL